MRDNIWRLWGHLPVKSIECSAAVLVWSSLPQTFLNKEIIHIWAIHRVTHQGRQGVHLCRLLRCTVVSGLNDSGEGGALKIRELWKSRALMITIIRSWRITPNAMLSGIRILVDLLLPYSILRCFWLVTKGKRKKSQGGIQVTIAGVFSIRLRKSWRWMKGGSRQTGLQTMMDFYSHDNYLNSHLFVVFFSSSLSKYTLLWSIPWTQSSWPLASLLF